MKSSKCSMKFMTKKNLCSQFSLILLVILLAFALSGCKNSSLNLKGKHELKQEYKFHAADKNVSIYYNVKKMGEGLNIEGVVKNKSGMFMQDTSLNMTDCCKSAETAVRHSYIYVGNIKMYSVKPFKFFLKAQNLETVNISYSFLPLMEAMLVNKDEKEHYQRLNEETGTLTLILK